MRKADGNIYWKLPGGEQGNDESLHHTGVRALEQATGIGLELWRDKRLSSPVVHALTNTTYYAYNLSQPLMQVTLRSSGTRHQSGQDEVLETKWVDRRQAPSRMWRMEDAVLLDRLTAHG